PPRDPGVVAGDALRSPGRCEELELPVPRWRPPERQQPVRPRLVTLSLARPLVESLARVLEPTLLTLQAGQNLPLPTLPDPLDPHRRETAIRFSKRGLRRACTWG